MAILSERAARVRVRRPIAWRLRRPIVWRTSAGAAVAVLLAVLVCAPAVDAARVGDRAPDFTLADRKGRPVTLTDARGDVVIVDFWASWCVPCAPMLPVLDALARRYGGRVRVYAIDLDQSAEKAEAFLREYLPSPSPFFTVLDDAHATVLARYGASGMPALFVVAPDGTIRLIEVGYSPEHVRAVEDAVGALLPQTSLGERTAPQASADCTPPPSEARDR